jgi:hypothetical protein
MTVLFNFVLVCKYSLIFTPCFTKNIYVNSDGIVARNRMTRVAPGVTTPYIELMPLIVVIQNKKAKMFTTINYLPGCKKTRPI